MKEIYGIPVSAGIAIGTVWIYDSQTVHLPHYTIPPEKRAEEEKRFEKAVAAAGRDLEKIRSTLSEKSSSMESLMIDSRNSGRKKCGMGFGRGFRFLYPNAQRIGR